MKLYLLYDKNFVQSAESLYCAHVVSAAVDQDKIHQIVEEERALKEENVRLQRRLQREKQRREELSRQLSESESSLEMEDERCGMFFSCVFV